MLLHAPSIEKGKVVPQSTSQLYLPGRKGEVCAISIEAHSSRHRKGHGHKSADMENFARPEQEGL